MRRIGATSAAGLGGSIALSVTLLACSDPTLVGRATDAAVARTLDAGKLPAATVDGDVSVVPERDARVNLTTADASGASGASDAGSLGTSSGSCFGRCGAPELLALDGDCACDVGCLRRADCCADKHELCPVSERSAFCALTGKSLDPALLGTDLGFSFAHADRVEILLGDSYGSDGTDPYPYDDAQGTLPTIRPDGLPSQLATQTPAPLSCTGMLTLDKATGGSTDNFAPIRLFEDGKALSSWLSDTPLTGFSDGTHAYMIARRGSKIEDPLYVAVRDPTPAPDLLPARTVYRVGQRYSSTHFQNPSIATVARFDPSAPSVHDYGPGSGALLMFGRGDFAGDNSRAVYLAVHPLPLVQTDGSFVWSPTYYAGQTNGQPSFSADEQLAVPVLAGDFERPMQTDVAWVPALSKWLMLYGGDVADWLDATPNDQPRHGALHMRMADHPWGPWTATTPVFWREHMAAYLHCDAPPQPAPGQQAGCDLDELPNHPAHSYSSGRWGPELLDFPGCIASDLTPAQPNFQSGGVVPCLGTQRGNLYAPSLIDAWTADLAGDQGYAHAATVYFTVSTWMPYQVVLAALTIHLP